MLIDQLATLAATRALTVTTRSATLVVSETAQAALSGAPPHGSQPSFSILLDGLSTGCTRSATPTGD